MTTPRPGKDGDPLPEDTLVFRVGKNSELSPAALERRRALPIMFELSSEDKKSPGQRLSVWAEALTIADQAWDFMGSNPARTVVACSKGSTIREIPPQPDFLPLRVQWE